MTEQTTPDFLTVTDVAGLCHVSRQTVVVWINSGKLPEPICIGRRFLFPKPEFMTFLESQRRRTLRQQPA